MSLLNKYLKKVYSEGMSSYDHWKTTDPSDNGEAEAQESFWDDCWEEEEEREYERLAENGIIKDKSGVLRDEDGEPYNMEKFRKAVDERIKDAWDEQIRNNREEY